MITAAEHGWEQLRRETFRRDNGCVATQFRIFGRDTAPDGCRNGFGNPMPWDQYAGLEWDHVKEHSAISKKAPDDIAHGVMVCPWHHRLSQQWRSDSAKHRSAIRDWLKKNHPEAWDAGT